MKAPVSWLKEYVDITLRTDTLAEKLTEVGLGVEKIIKDGTDTIFDLEITPNRPDCLSIIGIAREIAAIENKKINLVIPEIKIPKEITLPIKLSPDYDLFYRWTGVTIADVEIKDSPKWLQDRLIKVGLRPINNIVDITNYVMFELGVPLHAFDYDSIKGHTMKVELAKGGEEFTSVDEKSYHLPKDAIIISDKERIIDLAGIKGGLNSGIKTNTKNIFLHVTIDNPILIRRASLALALRSDASAIYERGTNKGGTIDTLKRAASLIVELAGGKIASDIIDLKKDNFEPWKLTLRKERLDFVLGISLPDADVINLLERLNLSPKKNGNVIECTIPTYRNDLKIEEDLIEEVARLYGYNNFPKTMPEGGIPVTTIPYFKDYTLDRTIKEVFVGCGFSEVYTYSLVSEKEIITGGFDPEKVLRVDNPVSREFEYLRPTIKTSLVNALYENVAYFENVNLFELGKIYTGKNIAEAQECYVLSGITNSKNFYEVKGMLVLLFKKLGIEKDPTSYIHILDKAIFFEVPIQELLKDANPTKIFVPLPKHPPFIEDIALTVTKKVKVGEIIDEIKKQSSVIKEVSLLDEYKDTKTFHIVYQHKDKNLTTEDIKPIRKKILAALKERFGVKTKET